MQQRGFGDLEAVVMDRVWASDEAVTVREIFDDLAAKREIAYTTVMSTMDNLHRKGWLERTRVGKAYSYWPTMTREERSANLMRDALHAGGDADLVLNFFLNQINDEESEQLRVALRKLARRRGAT
ncbi:CopY family transcriptional regulator [Mycolicibacterium mageritense DSM 44476 = CIP 104973]|uniref:Transcriptional regulator BlaI n=1 Tax=Mycolicibacterium mageritense TaxID=53462 RepID=A0AAI8TXA5_MYCME|nr:BlaI/MecI/CopY family transcriptional regulator [Mycolicibacterium mageritense]MBN3453153.1 BlaI/MecI/CopY family transcriptional regulator [Mycobacterium sp. DSM 3803]OKH83928.1 CopY family transcriptional regulator [Mycobacterium sp. SWH-M3]MCC9180381.1 BlaI/MecI/CopY family transcriptional regulator [Mycolicibacterium mageritense]TXI53797.1 MAG: BlaI/MecI/CopY family transcriptional regulator [Mycolicibacterium mageritense]CDO19849.1 transcriptional regulatory protein [Mycolicibacterium 